MSKKSPRHLSRSLAVQGIYYHRINQANIVDIEEFLRNTCSGVYPKANYELMHFLLEGGTSQFESMLNLYTGYLQREINQINTIEQVILVLAAIELTNNPSVPSTVIIDEAIELAKLYGADDSYKFINNLVDKLANKVR